MQAELEKGAEHEEAIKQAVMVVNQFKAQQDKLQQERDQALRDLEAIKKQLVEIQLKNAELETNLLTRESICEDLRQEAFNLRQSFYRIASELDHYDFPAPVLKRGHRGGDENESSP